MTVLSAECPLALKEITDVVERDLQLILMLAAGEVNIPDQEMLMLVVETGTLDTAHEYDDFRVSRRRTAEIALRSGCLNEET